MTQTESLPDGVSNSSTVNIAELIVALTPLRPPSQKKINSELQMHCYENVTKCQMKDVQRNIFLLETDQMNIWLLGYLGEPIRG